MALRTITPSRGLSFKTSEKLLIIRSTFAVTLSRQRGPTCAINARNSSGIAGSAALVIVIDKRSHMAEIWILPARRSAEAACRRSSNDGAGIRALSRLEMIVAALVQLVIRVAHGL